MEALTIHVLISFSVAEDDSLPEPYRPLVDSGDEDEGADGDAPTFNDEEDAKYIEESKRRAMKKKGINPKAGKQDKVMVKA